MAHEQNRCRRSLDHLIHTFAKESETSPFSWHLTLIGGIPPEALPTYERCIEQLIVQFPTHSAQATAAGGVPDNPQQALFLRFEEDSWLKSLRASVQKVPYDGVPLPPFWHGSLRYGTINEADYHALIARAACFVGVDIPITHVELWHTEGVVSEWVQIVCRGLRN